MNALPSLFTGCCIARVHSSESIGPPPFERATYHARLMGTDELGIVDPTSEAYWHDIHGVLAPLREQAPVARSTVGSYEVLRYEHCEPLLRDATLHQALQGMLTYQGIADGPLYQWWQLIMNNHDAPTHTRLRSLVG